MIYYQYKPLLNYNKMILENNECDDSDSNEYTILSI